MIRKNFVGLYLGLPIMAHKNLVGMYLGRPTMAREILWAFSWVGPFKLVGPCHVLMYNRRLLSSEWMTSVPTMSRHVFPLAHDDFTRGKSPLVGAVNGLSDPKPDPIA